MLKNSKRMKLGLLLIPICVATMAATAFAGNSFTSYNTTVGRLNGSGYSGTQTKETSGANGRIKSGTVGGDYTVDVRMQKSNGTASGDWYRDLDDGEDTGYSIDGDSNQKHGDSVRLQFSNDLTTTVNVQVDGEWVSQ